MGKYDAIVIGSGPNGLAAGITLQREGYRVLIIEGKDTIGGGLRTLPLTLPGFQHDVCSAVHPMAAGSPFFRTLPLQEFGLEFLYPEICAAHPLTDGNTGALYASMELTAKTLGEDEARYLKLFQPLVANWPKIENSLLGPLQIPRHILPMIGFGLKALEPAGYFARRFKSAAAKAFWAGMAAHSIMPLHQPATSAIGLVLMILAHIMGWPIPKGGSQSIANAMAAYFKSLGGEITTGFYVTKLSELPESKCVLFDTTPKQLLTIAGHKLSSIYKWQIKRYRHGPGVFKIDWALSGPVPFKDEACRKAGTIHLGNTMEEILHSESEIAKGRISGTPFILLSQPSVWDPTRAPEGKHALWGYCHVPHGSREDYTTLIENRIEQFAPGFRNLILSRHVMTAADMEEYNPNYPGGDINNGMQSLDQIFTRPALRLSPYKTSARGLFLCSSATPPGGGVHGMCGYHAARKAMDYLKSL